MPTNWLIIIAIGACAGFASGFFGIGGGLILVPCLVYFCKFSQHQAVATSLAIMLPPVTFFAVWEYYKKGWVDVKIAVVLVILMLIFSYLASLIAKNLDALQMKLYFSIFAIIAGIYMLVDSLIKIKGRP